MNSKLNVIRVGLTCVIGVSVLSACADRMTSLKARRVSCNEYNDYARKNSKPLLCQGDIANKNEPEEMIEIPADLKDLQGNGQFEQNQAPVANVDKAETKSETKSETTDSTAQPKVIIEGSQQNLTGGYARAAWLEKFNNLINLKDESAVKMVKGITVTSGADKSGQAVATVQAVIIFNGKPMYLQTSPSAQVVRFDEKMVMPMGVDVRPQVSAQPIVLSDELIVTATCLREESPCSEFGLMLDFGLKAYKGKDSRDRLMAVFKVKSGSGDKQGVNGTGVIDSNLKDAIQTFAEGQKVMPAEGTVEPTRSDLLKGAQTAAGDVAKKVDIAEEAFQAATAAKNAGDAQLAEQEAQKAEQAAKDAEAAQAIVADWMERLKAVENGDAAKIAEIDAMIAASAKRVEEAKNYANGARIEANYAKASAATKPEAAAAEASEEELN